jgi:PAS domain S-box-containing protein
MNGGGMRKHNAGVNAGLVAVGTEPPPFTELIALDRMQGMLLHFHRAMGLPAILLSVPDSQVLLHTGWTDLCTKFHLSRPELTPHCPYRNGDLVRGAIAGGLPACQECLAGLRCASVPVWVEGHILACLATGQAFTQPPDWAAIRIQAIRNGFPPDEYVEAARRIPVVPPERMDDALTFLNELAGWAGEQAMTVLREARARRALERESEKLRAAEDALERIRQCLLDAVPDPLENMRRLVALASEYLVADFSMYSRIANDHLHTVAAWNPPPGFVREGPAEGHLCHEVYRTDARLPVVARRLQEGAFARTDPNVAAYGLHTYAGVCVGRAPDRFGVLCTLFRRDLALEPLQLRVMEWIAAALAAEELRQRAVDELTASEARFRTLLARVPGVAVQGYAPDGTVRYWNTASERLYGYAAVEALGRSLYDLILPPGARTKVEAAVRRMVETGEPEPPGEHLLRHKDGSEVPVFSSHAVVREPGGAPELFSMDIDLTGRLQEEAERMALERDRHHSERTELVGRLAGGVAHDFNNLLMAVMGNLEMAQEELSGHDVALGNIQQALQASAKASDLVRQLLAYAGKGVFFPRRIQLDEILRTGQSLLRSAVPASIELDVRLERGPLEVVADSAQTLQVVMSLVLNAAEAIGDRPGRIVVTAGKRRFSAEEVQGTSDSHGVPPGEYIFLEVRDNGAGMDAETLAHVFEPFFTTKFLGRGLGLPAVLGILRRHGGRLCIDSRPGQGTTVRALFPPAGAAPAPADAAAPRAGAVLYAEDDAGVRLPCAALLRRQGFEVVEAADGVEALRLFAERPDAFACVLLDLAMPRKDGAETFREITALRPDIPIILCSGYDARDTLKLLPGHAPSDYLQKPYSAEAVRAALARAGVVAAVSRES